MAKNMFVPKGEFDAMSSFSERWGQLTVEQAKELSEAVERTCYFETTAAGGEE